MPSFRPLARPLTLVAALVALFALNVHFGVADMLRSTDTVAGFKTLLDNNLVLAVAVFCAATALCASLLAVPGVVFAVAAGLVFGPVLGTLCCWLGACAGAIAAFVLGRYFLQDATHALVSKNPLLKEWLFGDKSNNLFYALMVTRLVPLFPFNIQNFAYGATNIGMREYVAGTLVFTLPGTAAYTVAASSLAGGEGSLACLGVASALMALVCFITMAVKKNAASCQGSEDNESEREQGECHV